MNAMGDLSRLAAHEVPDAELSRFLGYPAGFALEGRAGEVARGSREWMARRSRCWTVWRALSIDRIDGDSIVLVDGAVLRSGPLARGVHDHGCDRVAVVAASAGSEVDTRADELWRGGRPDEAYFLQRLAAAVVEWLTQHAVARVERESDGLVIVTHSPGYSGWDLAEQTALLETLISPPADSLPGPFRILESGAIQPQMSKLSAHGLRPVRHDSGVTVSERIGNPCSPCRHPGCGFRRRPTRKGNR